MTLLGGGFGRKSKNDFVGEAALLAQQNPGVPVRVQWTREDDIMHSYYHAVSHQYLKAGAGSYGRDSKPRRTTRPLGASTIARFCDGCGR